MPVSEYARSEYEEDSDCGLSDEGVIEYPDSAEQEADQQTKDSSSAEIPASKIEESGNHLERSSSVDGHEPINSPNDSMDSASFLNHVNRIMDKVKRLQSETDWTRVLKHRTGVEVFVQKNEKSGAGHATKPVPIFKGVGLIKGYSPASVFSVVGSSKLWDEWYEDGNLVENLSDQVSLTYMRMKAAIGTRTRDLALVEKVEATTDGSILFCASSVNTPRIPTVPGRVRAHIELNGWVLEPINLPMGDHTLSESHTTIATKVTYYLQVNVKTFIAEAISKRYLARRPLCITKIDSYLQKHGSPIQIEGISETEAYPGQGGSRRSFHRGFLSIKQLELPKESSNDHSVASSVSSPGETPPSASQSTKGKRYPFASLGRPSPKSQPSAHRLPASASVPAFNPNQSPSRRDMRKGSTNSKRSLSAVKPVRPDLSPLTSPGGSYQEGDQPMMVDHLRPNEAIPEWKALTEDMDLLQLCLKDSHENHQDWNLIINAQNSSSMLLNYTCMSKLIKKIPAGGTPPQLPIVKSEGILSNHFGSNPITKSQVLVTLQSSLAQYVWDQDFSGYSKLDSTSSAHQLLLCTDNGFDQGVYLSTMRSVYPHIPDESVFCFNQMVVRRPIDPREDSIQSKIFVIQRSVNDEQRILQRLETLSPSRKDQSTMDNVLKEKIVGKLMSRIVLGGWIIQTGATANEIQIIHLSALELQQRASSEGKHSLPPFLIKLIASSIANRPQRLSTFIQDYGFCPGFVRWASGQIEYLGDFDLSEGGSGVVNGDGPRGITKGQVEWRFSIKDQTLLQINVEGVPNGVKSEQSDQICWFQWCDKMYPSGIELRLEPPEAADVKLVRRLQNTLQFNWNQKFNVSDQKKIILQAKPIGNDPLTFGKILLNGKVVSEPIEPPMKRSHAKRYLSAPIKSLKNLKEDPNTLVTRQSQKTLNKDGSTNKRSKSTSVSSHKAEQIHSTITRENPTILLTNFKDEKTMVLTHKSNETNRKKFNSGKVDKKEKNENGRDEDDQIVFDSNVMLIITRDLYFTKSQVLFLVICIGFAYLYGKFG